MSHKEEISARSSKLSPAKRALLEKRLRGEAESSANPIPRRSDAAPAPLSFAQQRLWFLQQLEPDNPFYNEQAALRLRGPIDVSALEWSLNALVQRHEVLRTTFEVREGQPTQIIAPNVSLTLSKVDLRHLAEGEQDAEVQRLAAEQSQHRFNLAEAPLLRWMLLQLGEQDDEQDHVLLFTIHHIIFDGWSIDILIRELSVLYTGFSTGQFDPQHPALLPELPIQYADFAIWQRQWLQAEKLQSQLAYWKQQLDNAPLILQLPADRPRPPVQSYRGTTQSFLLPECLTATLKQINRETGTTLFMLLLAAFNILLYRYTGKEDILVGSPVSNRNHTDVAELIGVFLNNLTLRTDLSGNPTVEELLGRVRQMTIQAYANQDLPFEKLVEELQPERNANYNPLFQVGFTLHNTPRSDFELPGLTIAPLSIDRSRALLDLRLEMTETNQGLICGWEYNTDLFDAARVSRMHGHFQTLLSAIASNRQQPISELPLLTEMEHYQILVAWNDTAAAYPQDQCIHQLFEAQVQRTPDAVAVEFADQQLTYGQLNARANQLAHFLQQRGVAPEVLVGICVDRSLEMVIAVLGVLKAGAAYVPLDPSYPEARLEWMLSDSQMPLLLTQQTLLKDLPASQAQPICLDTDWDSIAQQHPDNLTSSATPNPLAYVIYTSGSTGKPKGVQILHSSLLNFLHAMQQQLGLFTADVVLSATSISFDIAALELFLPLITGARLIIASREVATDGRQLSRQLHTTGATLMQATPATWRMLLTAGWSGQPDLKILCGGEALSRELAEKLWHRGAAVWNLYGPTETTIWSMVYRVETVDRSLATVPIGFPIGNTQVYLLDAHNQPVPIGVAAELHLGGAGLARGYLNRPELTAEKFIVHPQFGKLYKTGDRARYRPDGTIEYLGRIDHQVKLRGFRIELGEIEAVLSRHAAVREAVVVVQETEQDQHLVAYVVPDIVPDAGTHAPTQISASELRGFLQQQLPDYMLPAVYVPLNALPLTPNGKIDRNALPVPELAQLRAEADHTPPATPIEKMLSNIWASILGREQISIHDNFFELGGHSLLATQIISQMQQQFQVELPLRNLFESPTIAALAHTIETTAKASLGLNAPAIERRTSPETVPLSFAQQRMWFLAQLEPDNPFYNLPIAVSLQGPLNLHALQHTFNEILNRHEVLRTRVKTQAGKAIVCIAPATASPLPKIDLSQSVESQRAAEVQRLIATEARQPFDLTGDLLLRVKLLYLEEHDHILLLTLHHIVADGWSFGILIREITALYNAFCQGYPSPLPKLPLQYADFADWQHQWLQGEILQRQIGYWRQHLQDAPVLLNLPTDRSRPAVQTYRGSRYSFELSPGLSQELHHLSRQAGCTLFMTLLAAFTILLGRYSSSHDIVIGTPIANRHRAEVENLIGCFVNTLVLRTNLSNNPTVLQLLDQVREVALNGYAHQDLPFEQLVEDLQPQRSLSHTPLFQVMFVLQNAPLPEAELCDLTVTPLENHNGTTQFDLTLTITETAQHIVGSLEYNCDLFEPDTIARMASHYLTLLESITPNPNQRLSELPLLTEAERYQLLVEWNQTQIEYSRDRCIHHLFEAQVQRTPDAIAVVFADQQISYRELNSRANQLAHYLNRMSVQPETLIGICLERSLEMLIGLLGILKAGGAYLPLDPSYPKERLAFMLQDAQVSLLVTQQSLLPQLPDHQAQVVCLDADGATLAQESQQNPAAQMHPDQLAYLIYTSGSTGVPKGVMVEHRALVNYTQAIASAYAITTSDRILQFASLNFDVAAEEIFPCLVQGATLVLRSDALLHSIPEFLNQVQTLRLSVINLPTALWHQLTAELAATHLLLPDSLRLVVIGGERALPDRLRTWQQVVGQRVRLLNCYGPTETTIGATLCELSEANTSEPSGWEVPIGKPIANVQTYVLDAQLQPVPIGVPAELYIGGIGVARGYLNRLQLTAEQFIEHSVLGRLYRSGDWVRYRSDGNLEYLGRLDAQVKLRGFRIELGEIEAALSQHPQVRAVVVAVRETQSGGKRLVAYLVSDPEANPAPGELRQFLQSQLPDYMLPSAFVQLDALPLTPNGKLDRASVAEQYRNALPEPDQARPELDAATKAALTPVEVKLVEIWAEVLGVAQVGIHDNFFELGGDSILSIQVVARANQAGLQLTPKQLFEHQTIAALAAVAGTRTMTRSGTQAEQGLVTGAVPLTPIQTWFFEQELPELHHFNQAVLLQIPPNINPDLLEQAFRQLLHHHDALRLRFESTESGWQQIHISAAPGIPFLRRDFSALTEAEQRLALESAANELQASLNLSIGSIARAGYFDLGTAQPGRLLLVIHHLVVDGVSWRILLEDLQTAYQQLSGGKPVQLLAKTTSFQQWSQQLRNYAQLDLLQSEQDYWLAVSQQSFIPLPIDFARGNNTVASTCNVTSVLTHPDTQALLKDVSQAYHTEINEVLLTALVQAFAQWTGQSTLRVDLEGHGREPIFDDVDVSRTVGWFTTVFPVFLTLGEATQPGDVLKVVKEQLRSIPHRGIGYGILRYLNVDRRIYQTLKRLPQAEVLFNYFGQFDQTLSQSSLFQLAQESNGAPQAPQGKRSHLLEINGWVNQGQLQLHWNYSQELHRHSTIETLAEHFLQALRSLIFHCQSPDAGGYTPSDFAEANLSQSELDRFLTKINRRS